MRFFKIFLVVFLSLIGALGATLGVMYLTGYFSKDIIEPESIYFEFAEGENEYNLSSDAYVKILSSTEGVTVTNLTLSLDGEEKPDEEQEDGVWYVTDGIIKVPKYVNIGQAFKIELCTEANEELDNEEWIHGGTTVLTADSPSLKASEIRANVNVDVPVKSVEVITYANDTDNQPTTQFAAGETFYAKAEFLPKASLYKFSQDGKNGKPVQMKKVFFDAISAGEVSSVGFNAEVNAELEAQGITNIKAYKALSQTDNLSVNAYAFLNSTLEEEYVENTGGDTEQILADLKHSNVSASAKKEVEIETLVINSFTIAQSSTTKTLTFNSVNKIFANYGASSSALNFGIEIKDSNSSSPKLQSKIKNVGIEVYLKTGNTYSKATSGTDFLIVDPLNQVVIPTADGLYLPNVVEADVNKSYWNFVPLVQNYEFAFTLYVLNDDLSKTAVTPAQTYAPEYSQVWKSSQIVESEISWTNDDEVSLTVVDAVKAEDVKSEEFDLSTILAFTPGTYSIMKYVAYIEGSQADLTKLLKTCVPTEKYNTNDLGVSENTLVFELTSPILKLSPNTIKLFKVKAVVLISDFMGKIDAEHYTVYKSTPALVVNANKTVKELSASIEVQSADLLKNLNPESEEPILPPTPEQPEGGEEEPGLEPLAETGALDRLAFVMGTNENIFDVVFTVKANTQEELNEEVAIFLADFNSGKILLNARIMGEQQNVVSRAEGMQEPVSATEWKYRISYISGTANKDTSLWFEYVYQHTQTSSYMQSIKTVEFNKADNGFTGAEFAEEVDRALIEMYDGKVYDLEFKYDNTHETPIEQRTEIVGENVCGEREGAQVYFAEDVKRKYLAAGEEIDGIIDSLGHFKVIAKDKYGNQLSDVSYQYQPLKKPNPTGSEFYSYYYLTTTNYSNALTEAPSDELYFADENTKTIVSTGVNRGKIDVGIWNSDDIATGFTPITAEEAKNEIEIVRYGVRGQSIQITGTQGLLSVFYATQSLEDETQYSYYELCNVLSYTFSSDLTVFDGIISYNTETGNLQILRAVGTDINLLLNVTTELGISYIIKLVIKPNVTMQVELASSQGTLAKTAIFDSKQHFLVYSDNEIELVVKITFRLVEDIKLILEKGVFADEQGGSSQITFTPRSFTASSAVAVEELKVKLSFSRTELLSQTVNILTDGSLVNPYVFAKEMNFMVYPNASFASGKKTLEKHITIQNFSAYYDVISNDEIARVIPGITELTKDQLSIAFTQVAGKDKVFVNAESTPLATNIFAWDDQAQKLQCKSTMSAIFDLAGEYTAHLTVKYGKEIIGEIVVKISSCIAPDNAQEDYANRFVIYDGKMHFVLNSGEVITTEQIKALFNNVEVVSLSVDENLIMTNDSTTFTVSSQIKTYISSTQTNKLVLKHIVQDADTNEITIAEIVFPILLVPFDANFVSYKTAPDFEGKSLGIANASQLKDASKLYAYNVYDEYKSGENVCLFKLVGQLYGLSSVVLDAIKDLSVPYRILLEGQNGLITTQKYPGTFNQTTGYLQTLPSSQDQFVYFVVYSDANETEIIALYRIKIVANSAINVYYPYAEGPLATENVVMAEYIYAESGEALEINLEEEFDKTMPNSGNKRVQLDVFNETYSRFEETSQEYSVEYSLYKVAGMMYQGNAGTILMTYGVSLTNNILNIANGGQQIDIVLKAVVTQGLTTMGEAYYTIRLNSDQLALYSIKQGINDYTTTNQTIYKSASENYDFSQIKLYKTEGAVSSQDQSVPFGVHYYINGQDAQEFITESDKKLTLNDNAVSNKNVVFNYYTIFGVVHTINLTFVSDYSIALSNTQTDVVLNGDAYEIYADVTVSLKDVFTISNKDGNVGLTNVEYEYWDGQKHFTGDKITFAQPAEEKELHTIKVKAKFEKANIATEDYEFTFFINVLQSVKSNFVDTDFVLSETEVIYNQSYGTDGIVFDKLLKILFLTDEEIQGGGNIGGEGEGTPTEPEEIFMFNSVSESVLEDYKLIATISSNSAGYVGFDNSGAMRKEMIYDEFILLKENFIIYLLKSPGQDPLRVTITFEFTKDYGETRSSVKANLTFVVVSDIIVTLNYPQANQNSNLTQEYIYLENAYSGEANAKEFDFCKENGAYFNTSRVVLTSKTVNAVDVSRVKILARSIDEYVLIDGETSITKAYGEKFNIKWKNQTTGILTSEAEFVVMVDDVVRGIYTIIFKNDINEIFAVQSLKNLYENATANSAENLETYYVDNKNTELIFSHKTALLTFTSRPQTEAVTLVAFVQNDAGTDKQELGKITLSQEGKLNKWLLVNEKTYDIKEDLSNVIVQVEGDTKTNYAFDIAATNHVFEKFMYSDINLEYRLEMAYMGETLDYEKYNSNLLYIGTTPTVESFKIGRSQEVTGSLEFKIENAALFTKYHYEVIFDFVCEDAFATHNSEILNKDASLTITSPSSISTDNETSLGNEVFGITSLSGEAFNKAYFETHDVKYNAQIVMVTKHDFETNPVQANVKYLQANKVWLMNQYFPDITAASSVLCAAINPKFDDENRVYDFNFQALGAENDGNYVYVLVTYSAEDTAKGEIKESNIANYAYAIIKVFVKPNNNSIALFNDATHTANSFEDNGRYKITYKQDGTFDEIMLGKNGDTMEDGNLIYIFGANLNSIAPKNLIASSDGQDPTTLTLCGDISKYMVLNQIGGAYYLAQKDGAVAIYGDKEGYIQIRDMYGYEKNFYIVLKAQNADTAVSIVSQDEGGAFVNQIDGTQNKYYTGTQMTIIDTEESTTFMDMGAIKLNNFKVLTDRVKASTTADKWQYQVSYAIPELNFEQKTNPVFTGVGEPIKTFVIPSITEDSKDVTLYIYITITHNDVEEVVTLQTSLAIEKRFKLTDTLDSTSSVQAGMSFDVAEYLSVKDEANLGANLGGTNISGNVLTLKVKATTDNIGKILTVNAIHNTDITLNKTGAGIVVGKDFNDQDKTATNGFYYYALVDHPVFNGINFSHYKFSVVGEEAVLQESNLLADKIIYLTTSNVNAAQKVYVQINNSKVSYAIPYNLSVNGIQAKSLAEVIEGGWLVSSLTHTPITSNLPEIQTYGTSEVGVTPTDSIYGFVISSTPVSAEDLQTIKNFKIFDGSLKLKIEKINESIDLKQINFTVNIFSSSDELLAGKTYYITENISHYRYISVYDLLGGNVNVGEVYKVQISYLLSQGNIASIISYNGQNASVGAKKDNMYPYTLTSTFEFTQIEAGETETIDVLSASAFENKIYKTEKSYLVMYLNQAVYESKKLAFNVTPKYYAVSQSSNAHYIYANQYTVNNGIYTVEFNTWASTFELVSLSGEVLATLNNDADLEFKINIGGAGSGSAKFDAENNLITTDTYNEDQSFVIEVWVPVADGSIHIGNVTIILSHSQVYVANPATYMFIITYQDQGNTIDSSYTFTEHVTSIEDLVFNNPSKQLQDLVNKDEKTIKINNEYKKVSSCNIQIVTVIEQVFSAEYVLKTVEVEENKTELREFLQLKLKLNETSSSDGKSVELQVEAKSKLTSVRADTTHLNLQIDKKAGENLEFDIKCGDSTSQRVANGVYIVDIPFTSVYQNLIGEDFAYAAKVMSTASTNAELLYAKRTQSKSDFTNGQTMFFALSFVDNQNVMHYTLLATKFDEDNSQMFETDGYFTLNISQLPIIDGATVLTEENGVYKSQVACYSIKFLGAYDMDLSASDLLISTKIDGQNTTYSVGKVTYNADTPYEISINGEEIYNQLISSSTEVVLSLYSPANTQALGLFNLPSVIDFEVSGLTFIGVYADSVTDIKVMAIEPTGTETLLPISIDLSVFVTPVPYITIMDLSAKLTGTNPDGDTFWLQNDGKCVVKTSSVKTAYTNHNQYVFDYNMLLNANTAQQITEIDLTDLVSSAQSGNYYHFTLQKTGDTVNILYFVAQADANGKILVNPQDVFTGTFSQNARYIFDVENIVSTSMTGTLVYELYNNSSLVGVKSVSASAQGGVYVLSENILELGANYAKQNTLNAYSVSVSPNTMTYILTTKGAEKTYDAVFTDSAVFEIDLSTLSVGEMITISVVSTGFSGFNTETDSITLHITQSENDKTFNITYQGGNKEITVLNGNQTFVIDKTVLGEIGTIDLTIQPL